MVRVRKLVLAIAAASALTSGMAHALGLGDISLKSALNQPLDAEIELLEVRDLSRGEVIPALAAVEEFNKVGVERPYFLTDLKFTPVLKPNGKSVIRVTSSKPVREPYLNFLIEVLWPNGRLLREYTVLLDPPLYSPQTVVAASPSLPQAAPMLPRAATQSPRVAPAPRAEAKLPAAAEPTPARAVAAAPRDDNRYRVGATDTLWQIAERARPSAAVSVHQTMLAIQQLNPDAFIGGNINRLKSGQVLRLPTEQQIRDRSRAEALAEVQAQNSAWREGRAVQPVAAARQLDATRRSEVGEAPAQVESADSLKLVSAAEGTAVRGSDNGVAGSEALADKLAVSQERLETSQRESQELKGRLDELQSQLEKLQRLIELKNAQLAKFQADQAGARPGEPVAGETPTASVAATPTPQATAAQSAHESAALEPATLAADAAPRTVGEGQPEAVAAPVVPESKPPLQQDSPIAAQAPAVSASPATPSEAEKPEAKPAASAPLHEPGLFDDLLANPLLLAAGGAVLALLAGLGLVVNSRRKAEAAEKEAVLQDDEPLASFAALESRSAEPQEKSVSDGGAPLLQPAALSTDPLAEAEMYSTYGRFSQAAELLHNAVNDEPQRIDLRIKLMEAYAEMGDRDGFVRQEAELGEIGGAQPQIDQLRARYPQILASGTAIATGAALGSVLEEFERATETPSSAPVGLDDEFSFDELSLDDLGLDGVALAAPTQDCEAKDDFNLSLDDLEAELERELAANPGAAVEPGLDLDELAFDALDDGASDFPGQSLVAALESEPDAKPSGIEQPETEDDFSLELDRLELGAQIDESQWSALEEAAPSAELVVASESPLAVDGDDEFLLELADLDLEDGVASVSADELPLEGLPELDTLELELQAMSLDGVGRDLDLALENALAAPAVGADEGVFDELPLPDERNGSALPAAELTGNEDLDFFADTDETTTKLELARTYIEMGDADGARDILDEVLKEGSDSQQREARDMMGRIA